MNVFIYIDPSWSYKFFEFNKPAISEYDFYTFLDEFYTSAMLYVQTQSNHRFNMTPQAYDTGITNALHLRSRYPTLANKLTQAFHDLFHSHRTALSALQGPITHIQTLCDETGILVGIVCTI